MNSVWMAVHSGSNTDHSLEMTVFRVLTIPGFVLEPAKLKWYLDIPRFSRINCPSPAEARKLKTHVFLLSNDVSL